MTSPLVSVVLPCYNAGEYVAEALGSILTQTHRDLEVLALDDGSTDQTLEHLESAADRDPRVRVLVNPENLGLIRSLNRAVHEARGDYIARMDADDVSAPDRLQQQVTLLRERPDIDVVGVGAEYLDARGAPAGPLQVRCTEPESARFLTCFGTPLVHPALLARADVMRRHPYRMTGDTLHTEDYELFARMIRDGVSLANLNVPLYKFRIHPDSVSRRYEQLQIENFVTCARRHLELMVGPQMEKGVHRALVNRIDGSVSGADLRRALARLDELRETFLEGLEPSSAAAREVDAIAHEQRLDILLQALLKGTITQSTTAMLLGVAALPSLLSRPSRAYLRAKLASRRLRRLV